MGTLMPAASLASMKAGWTAAPTLKGFEEAEEVTRLTTLPPQQNCQNRWF